MKNLFFKTSKNEFISINAIALVMPGEREILVTLADKKTVVVGGEDAEKLLTILDRMTFEIIA